MNKPVYNEYPKVLYHPVDDARMVNNERELEELKRLGFWYEHPLEAQQKRAEFENKLRVQKDASAKKAQADALDRAKNPKRASRGSKVRPAEDQNLARDADVSKEAHHLSEQERLDNAHKLEEAQVSDVKENRVESQMDVNANLKKDNLV